MRAKLVFVILVGAGLYAVTPVTGATRTWTGAAPPGVTQKFWSNAANWSTQVPVAGDSVVFSSGAAIIESILYNAASPNDDFVSVRFQAPGYALYTAGNLQLRIGSELSADFATSGSVNISVPVILTGPATFKAAGSRSILELGAVNVNGKALTFDGQGIVEIGGEVNGGGNIVKQGTGRVEFHEPVTGGGQCQIISGTLTCETAFTKNVFLSDGAVLSGTGPVTSLEAPGGRIRPGGSFHGRLTASQSVSLGADATLEIELGGNPPGAGFDQIAAPAIDLGGAQLHVEVQDGYLPLIGQEVIIAEVIAGGMAGGTFDGLPEGAVFEAGGVVFRITYTGGTGNDIALEPVGKSPTGIERVWTGDADSLWSNAGNWLGGFVPQPGDSVQFPEVAAAMKSPVNDLPSGYPVSLVRFLAGGYDLSGERLHVSERIVQQAPSDASANAFRCPLQPSGEADWELLVHLQSGGELSLDLPAGLTLSQSTQRLVLRSDVPDDAVALRWKSTVTGSGRVVKLGTGKAVVSGVLDHSGGVEISEGALQAEHTGALGPDLAEVTVDAGGTLILGKQGG